MPKSPRLWLFAGGLALVVALLFYKAKKASKAEFLAFMEGIAPEIEERYGIMPIITVTQASLESDFGQSGLAVDGKNLYGLKVSSQWLADGKPTWSGVTSEFVKKLGIDTEIKITDTFKKYGSWRASVLDWAELISGPYKTAYRYAQTGDLLGYGSAIYNTGYSTHPDYRGLLASTANDSATMERTA